MDDKNTYDTLVIGSGMTGGWAAKEFTENGYRTLVIERGRDVKHKEDYPNAFKAPWDYKYRGYDTREIKEEYSIQRLKYNFDASSMDFFASDKDHPVETPIDKPARWFRGYQTGGRSLIWGRGAYRMSDLEFGANQKDGNGTDWPIRYKDIAPWYDYVETFIGVCGTKENIDHYPDGKFLPAFEMNTAEKVIKDRIENHYENRKLIPNRFAHLTKIKPGQFKGRSECQSRDMCHAGCPYGAYFSSNSSTLPAAYETGKLTLKSNVIVESIIYDDEKGRAVGVRTINSITKERSVYYARVIFLCASTLASTSILLQSRTSKFPNGLSNSSGTLGHYLMDHHKNVGGSGILKGYEDSYYRGFRPGSLVIPNFRNVNRQEMDFLRGYGVYGGASRAGIDPNQIGIGKEFKEKLSKPGPWKMSLYAYGECLPYYANKVELHPEKKDQWGLPVLNISAEFKENEMKMRKDMKEQITAILKVAGLSDINVSEGSHIMGDSTHFMGTARMGLDPETSVLNQYNQSHDIPNLFVTDGSCMPSASYMSPSLTFMALTARACDYAVKAMKSGTL
jgi:choline dehydrogenase-like flavoprotein